MIITFIFVLGYVNFLIIYFAGYPNMALIGTSVAVFKTVMKWFSRTPFSKLLATKLNMKEIYIYV